MHLQAGVISRAKHGNSASEYEDAFFPLDFQAKCGLPFSCAIADGATESSFSGLWAQLLTKAYTQASGLAELERLCDTARRQWREETSKHVLPWYAEQKLEIGAYATLLGVTIDRADSTPFLKWKSFAVGDSCLFQVREGSAVTSFPIKNSEELAARPILLPSVGCDSLTEELYRLNDGILEAGDRLYLVTDAIAGWIFTSLDREEKPFDILDQVVRTGTLECFHELVERLWDEHRLKNDDCTVLWIDVIADSM